MKKGIVFTLALLVLCLPLAAHEPKIDKQPLKCIIVLPETPGTQMVTIDTRENVYIKKSGAVCWGADPQLGQSKTKVKEREYCIQDVGVIVFPHACAVAEKMFKR